MLDSMTDKAEGNSFNGMPELTEDDKFTLLEKAGVDKLYRNLRNVSEDLPKPVDEALGELWQMNKIGLNIEEDDRKKVGGIDALRRSVNDSLESTKASFHGGTNNWLLTSVNGLVRLAHGGEESNSDRNKGDVLYSGEDYIKKLRALGGDYVYVSSSVCNSEERQQVAAYIEGSRQDSLHSMDGLLIDGVHKSVNKILQIKEGKE